MAKFIKKRGKGSPGINTASLPDIVFMLLFFFMVVTKLRDAELKVRVVTPFGTELTKLEEKSLVNTIQLGDKFAEPVEIPLFLERFRVKIPEAQRPKITTSLRVDGKVTMGIVQDIKTELRKANQLKINYSTKKRPDAL